MSRQQIPTLMQSAGLDALVAFSTENVYYSAGTMLLTQRMIPSRLAIVVWYADGAATMIVCSIEIAQVRSESWIKDVRTYTEFQDSPVAVLARLLEEKGLAAGRIGLESAYLPAANHRELVELMPHGKLVDGDRVFDAARVIKSPEEIEILRKLAIDTDSAIRKAFSLARIGTSEIEMHDTMRQEVLRRGEDGVAFVVMTTGANSKLVHPTPSAMKIQAGDIVRTDFGALRGSYFGGYLSDLARTAFAGKPKVAYADTYKRLREVYDIVLREVKPGVRACDLYELCRSSFAARGLDFRTPHIGHNIGISIHENPMLNPVTTAELQPGMVLAIEPITFLDGFIFHVEDELVVTETGHELLSPAYDWSDVFTIS